jgi:hypothetical protein
MGEVINSLGESYFDLLRVELEIDLISSNITGQQLGIAFLLYK